MDIPVLRVWDEEKQDYVPIPALKGPPPIKGVDYFTPDDIQSMVAAVMEKCYPVGSLYISTSSENPKTIFGFGTWTQIKDTFLLAGGDTYAPGTIGGEASHTLSIDELPSHNHKFAYEENSATNTQARIAIPSQYLSVGSKKWRTTTSDLILNTGGGKAHNNMPPYLAVYVWKRTA